MKLPPEVTYIQAVHVVEIDGEPVDAIELIDGTVIAIDGITATLFPDLDGLLACEDEDETVKRPSIAL